MQNYSGVWGGDASRVCITNSFNSVGKKMITSMKTSQDISHLVLYKYTIFININSLN